MWASNARGVGKNHDFRRISCYRSMTAGRASNNCDGPPWGLPHWWLRISESCLSQPAGTTTAKRTERNFIVRSSKSEAKVTNNRRLCLTYYITEAIYCQIWRPLCNSRAIYLFLKLWRNSLEMAASAKCTFLTTDQKN